MKLIIQFKTPRIDVDENDEYFSYSCPKRESVDEVVVTAINTLIENKKRLGPGTEILMRIEDED